MKMSIARLITILIATIALVFTFIAGILSHIPWFSILQRTALSFLFFSFAGYFLGNWCEKYLRTLSPKPSEEPIGQNFDIVSQQIEQETEVFDPFTTNSFEHIETK